MIANYLPEDPEASIALEIALSPHDDQPVMLPLTPEVQKLWSVSARRNTPKQPDFTWN